MQNMIGSLVIGFVFLGTLLSAAPAFAAGPGMMGGMRDRAPGVFGTVSAINGTTLTVNSRGFGRNASTTNTTTTYTVDATNASVTKNGATSTIGAIVVGDMISAQGTVNGTTVTATTIRDGVPAGGEGRGGRGMGWGNASSTQPHSQIIQGNGQPIIGGDVTAINGNSVTVTNKSNVTYTVDVTNAKIEKSGAVSSVAALAVGDNVVVQGTVNGTSVTASSVMDSGTPPAQTTTNTTTSAPHQGGMGGFFSGIGGFFHSMFGFF